VGSERETGYQMAV